ncbi:MAG: aminopeptidase [Acidiphilium sp. 37-64-53]|uniref:M55 family metallopeptidase n=1 Tax=Acidiphilium TaxID=522 RepID=UPI000BC9F2C5|nr:MULTISPECIES: M55 family metallopeptidase [Acidiphilium]OYW00651.1 MAG: aminopeptidase [Acidiphilium sp. 37-64-53]OZB23257.1 MAG: aminopeptidase [Acidiphilium sp. 34-64-41]HQT85741.1 M55 family metallopeptidase [Acidiphilium rubrum]
MKIYICVDIEGVAGVVTPEQGTPGNAEYERARRLMTEEANAAIDGAIAAGATTIVVNDAHGPMTNLVVEQLRPEASFITGKPKPFNMFAGLTADFDAVFCIGHHAGASEFGVLAHTTNGFAFHGVSIDGRRLGETGLYGAYAGECGVPVVLVTGDDRCATANRPHFPGATFVVVKTALANRAAQAISVQAARSAIRAGAEAALRRIEGARPFLIDRPRSLELVMNQPALADLAETLPPAERIDALTIRFAIASVAEAIGWVNAISAMSTALR